MEWEGEVLEKLLKKKVIVVYDDKDKVSTRLGHVISVYNNFLVITTYPKGKPVVELIPLSRIIRVEIVEE